MPMDLESETGLAMSLPCDLIISAGSQNYPAATNKGKMSALEVESLNALAKQYSLTWYSFYSII